MAASKALNAAPWSVVSATGASRVPACTLNVLGACGADQVVPSCKGRGEFSSAGGFSRLCQLWPPGLSSRTLSRIWPPSPGRGWRSDRLPGDTPPRRRTARAPGLSWLAAGLLCVSFRDTSPKRREVARDARYALHTTQPWEDHAASYGEFVARGAARPDLPRPTRRWWRVPARRATGSFTTRAR